MKYVSGEHMPFLKIGYLIIWQNFAKRTLKISVRNGLKRRICFCMIIFMNWKPIYDVNLSTAECSI